MRSASQDKRHDPASPDSGRDRRERILLVAERLFAERGFNDVAVRDIAAAAGVTHPLIYYYWASKEDLLAAVLEHTQSRVRQMAPKGDAAELTSELARAYLKNSRRYLRIITRAFLDGTRPADWPGGFPGIEAALAAMDAAERLEPGDERDTIRRERLAIVTAMMNGWLLIEEQMLELVGLGPDDRDHARETLIQCVGEIMTGGESRA